MTRLWKSNHSVSPARDLSVGVYRSFVELIASRYDARSAKGLLLMCRIVARPRLCERMFGEC